MAFPVEDQASTLEPRGAVQGEPRGRLQGLGPPGEVPGGDGLRSANLADLAAVGGDRARLQRRARPAQQALDGGPRGGDVPLQSRPLPGGLALLVRARRQVPQEQLALAVPRWAAEGGLPHSGQALRVRAIGPSSALRPAPGEGPRERVVQQREGLGGDRGRGSGAHRCEGHRRVEGDQEGVHPVALGAHVDAAPGGAGPCARRGAEHAPVHGARHLDHGVADGLRVHAADRGVG